VQNITTASYLFDLYEPT